MKITIQILFILVAVITFSSCEKELASESHIYESSTEQDISYRSSGVECLSCEAIVINQELLSTDGQCGTSLLTIELVDVDCNPGTRHIVKANGEIITFFTSRLLELEIEHCDDVETTITVHGYDAENDKWDLVCFRERLTTSTQEDQMLHSYSDLSVE